MSEQDSTGMANGARAASSAGAPAAEEHITLSQAAKLAPGRPSPNCVWRWCREGIKAASGDRVRLKHVRFGSRIFTTRQWLNDFGQALAEADAAHFDCSRRLASQQRAAPLSTKKSTSKPRRGAKSPAGARRRHEQAMQELKEAGL